MAFCPPTGYLERLRSICDKYDILLIFDEVTCGFGRLGHAFAAERYGVLPDMITFAKGVTSGTAPMGGVIIRHPIYETFMARSTRSNCCTAIHILATLWLAPPRSPRSTSTAKKIFARALHLEPFGVTQCMA